MGVVAADGGELVRCWRKGWQWDRRRGRKKRKKKFLRQRGGAGSVVFGEKQKEEKIKIQSGGGWPAASTGKEEKKIKMEACLTAGQKSKPGEAALVF